MSTQTSLKKSSNILEDEARKTGDSTLNDISHLIEKAGGICRWCHAPLTARNIKSYQHPNGINVKVLFARAKKQRVYFQCSSECMQGYTQGSYFINSILYMRNKLKSAKKLMLTKPLRDLSHTIAEYNMVYKQPIKFSRLMANTRWSTIEVLNRIRLLIAYWFVIAEDSEDSFKDAFMITEKGKEFLGIRELLACAYG